MYIHVEKFKNKIKDKSHLLSYCLKLTTLNTGFFPIVCAYLCLCPPPCYTHILGLYLNTVLFLASAT